MSDSIMQAVRECYISGRTDNLHRHHVFGGGRRKLSEKWGLWVYLTADWHNAQSFGAHFNHDLDVRIKQEGQRAFEQIYSHERFMDVFGKNYLE